MHRNWPWLGWSRRTLLAFNAFGLVAVVAYFIGYVVIDLPEPAHTLVGVGGIIVMAVSVYISHGAFLASTLQDPEADRPL